MSSPNPYHPPDSRPSPSRPTNTAIGTLPADSPEDGPVYPTAPRDLLLPLFLKAVVSLAPILFAAPPRPSPHRPPRTAAPPAVPNAPLAASAPLPSSVPSSSTGHTAVSIPSATSPDCHLPA